MGKQAQAFIATMEQQAAVRAKDNHIATLEAQIVGLGGEPKPEAVFVPPTFAGAAPPDERTPEQKAEHKAAKKARKAAKKAKKAAKKAAAEAAAEAAAVDHVPAEPAAVTPDMATTVEDATGEG